MQPFINSQSDLNRVSKGGPWCQSVGTRNQRSEHRAYTGLQKGRHRNATELRNT